MAKTCFPLSKFSRVRRVNRRDLSLVAADCPSDNRKRYFGRQFHSRENYLAGQGQRWHCVVVSWCCSKASEITSSRLALGYATGNLKANYEPFVRQTEHRQGHKQKSRKKKVVLTSSLANNTGPVASPNRKSAVAGFPRTASLELKSKTSSISFKIKLVKKRAHWVNESRLNNYSISCLQ